MPPAARSSTRGSRRALFVWPPRHVGARLPAPAPAPTLARSQENQRIRRPMVKEPALSPSFRRQYSACAGAVQRQYSVACLDQAAVQRLRSVWSPGLGGQGARTDFSGLVCPSTIGAGRQVTRHGQVKGGQHSSGGSRRRPAAHPPACTLPRCHTGPASPSPRRPAGCGIPGLQMEQARKTERMTGGVRKGRYRRWHAPAACWRTQECMTAVRQHCGGHFKSMAGGQGMLVCSAGRQAGRQAGKQAGRQAH